MSNPKRLDVARAVEKSPAPKDDVAEALGVEVGSKQFEKAFGNAAENGLVEQQGNSGNWTVTKKGKRRLEHEA